MDDVDQDANENPLKRPAPVRPDSELSTPKSKRKKGKKDKKRKKDKKDKKRRKKASTPITLVGPQYDSEPVPHSTYDNLDAHNIAKEARAAELVPWPSELILHKEHSKTPEGDRLVKGYTFDPQKFSRNDYDKVLSF